MGQFRGGGDKVGAALANFINARNDARGRALRNEMFDRFMQDNYGQNPNRPNVAQGNGNESLNQFLQYRQQQQPQVGQSEVADAWNKMAPRGGYFAQGINSVEQPEAIGQPDNTMNIKDQTIGQNYNQRIDSQYNNGAMGGVNGMNVPRTPQNGFGQAIGNAENSVLQNSYKDVWGNNPNPSSPAVDNQTVQTTDGAQSVPQSKYQELVNRLASSKYLNDGYDFDSWAQRAREDGITGGALQNVMYRQRIKPLIDAAREDRLRESFRIANDESLDQKTRLDAVADLAYSIKQPDIAHEILYNREKEARERYKWELEKERLDWLRENGFMPSGGGGGRSPGRPRVYRDDESSGGGSPRRTRRTKKNGYNFDTPTFDGILTSMYEVPNGRITLSDVTRGTDGQPQARKDYLMLKGIQNQRDSNGNIIEDADKYQILEGQDQTPSVKKQTIADWAKSEDATRPLASGKFPLFDTEKGIIQGAVKNISEGLEREREESREAYKQKQLKGLKSKKGH